MFFKGDLSKYHPADAMAFLSQVGSDGVLTIADQDCLITLTFKAGRLLDAQSASGDRKLLRCLQHQGHLNDAQVRRIEQIQGETGISARELLAKLAFFPLADIRNLIKMSVLEVLRQLFLLDHGSFNFTEAPVEDDGAGIQTDAGKAALTVLPRADEYRDFIKTIQTVRRRVRVNADSSASDKATPSQQLVLNLAAQKPALNDLIDETPLPSHQVVQIIQQLMAQGAISLESAPKTSVSSAEPILDPLFAAYKQALKTLLNNQEVLPKLGALVSFGKLYYDDMLIFTAQKEQLIHCKTIRRTPENSLIQKTIKGNLGRIDQDPVFAAVYRSGVAFFGKTFPSPLLDSFSDQHPHGDGECALIPTLISPRISIFFYAGTSQTSSAGVTPHHYLELLSWVVNPGRVSIPAAETKQGPQTCNDESRTQKKPEPGIPSTTDTSERIAGMVGRIKDLPPLPTVVSKALQMLTDPETPVEDIETVIGQDQALVATLIKVGNSALYGGLQKVTTLRQVLTRLGLKTTRNLVLAASTRSYFMSHRKGMRVWGQFLWQHSVESGLAARRVAEAAHYPDPEEAFIGGLIHDIGKLVILMLFPDSYNEILKIKKIDPMLNTDAETRILGCDHQRIGRLLMDRWNMPDSAKACAEYHHRCRESEGHSGLAAIIAYADYLSRQYGTNPESLIDEDHVYAREVMDTLGLTRSMQAGLVETIIEDFQSAELMME